jgi:hypothetical protein
MRKDICVFKKFSRAKKLAGMTVTFGNRTRIWKVKKVEIVRIARIISAAIFTFESPLRRQGRSSEKEHMITVNDFEEAIIFYCGNRKVGFQMEDFPVMILHVPRKSTVLVGAFAE